MKKTSILFLIVNLLIGNSAFAADQKITNWKIDNSKSKIEFVATQNTSPINGSFAKFSGIINFSKLNVKDSNVAISIDLNSLKSSLPEASGALKETGWFNVKQFASAEFKSQKFVQIATNKFRSDGTLKIKGIELPVSVDFYFEQYSANQAVAIGEAKINRLDFGIGKKDENGVKDAVAIKFIIFATQ